MCGRFSLYEDEDTLAERLDAAPNPDGRPVRPSWNIAPTQRIVGVRLVQREVDGGADLGAGPPASAPGRMFGQFRWGLLGPWVTDPARAGSTFNARGETVAVKPTFRRAFASRRLLVPANSYYEWRRRGTAKQCRLIRRADGDLLVFAGLWEEWHDPADKATRLLTATIITVAAGPDTVELHDRQPVVLEPDTWSTWLDPSATDSGALATLLAPSPTGTLVHYRVDDRVGNVRNNDATLIAPLAELAP